MSVFSGHKKSSYGSCFNSTIGGLFFLLSVFTGLVQFLHILFYSASVTASNSIFSINARVFLKLFGTRSDSL